LPYLPAGCLDEHDVDMEWPDALIAVEAQDKQRQANNFDDFDKMPVLKV